MLRLVEIMGAMSFLEKLCNVSDGAQWREKTQTLIDAEDPHPARRERLAGAFNRGFNGYQDSVPHLHPFRDGHDGKIPHRGRGAGC